MFGGQKQQYLEFAVTYAVARHVVVQLLTTGHNHQRRAASFMAVGTYI